MIKNKWTGKLYEVVKDDGAVITLEDCLDNRVFTIAKSEFNFSYKPYNKKEAVEK